MKDIKTADPSTADLSIRRPSDRHLVSTELAIFDIHCSECAARLELAIEALPGVEKAEVNAATCLAVVSFRPGVVSLEDIVSGVRGVGFEMVQVAAVASG